MVWSGNISYDKTVRINVLENIRFFLPPEFHREPKFLQAESMNQCEPRRKGPWLGYIGDYTTQLYGDYNGPL